MGTTYHSDASDKKPSVTVRVLTLALGEERYALNVLSVREIIRPPDISPVPRAPAEFLGVINLRGKIIPVVDLRIKFGLEFIDRTERTCVVVVQTKGLGGSVRLTGLLVDEVQEVITLNTSEIEDGSDFNAANEVCYISGLAKTKQGVTILLDLDRMLTNSKGGFQGE